MDEFPNAKPIKVTDHLLSQAVELIDRDETDLYESLGLSSALWENLQEMDLTLFEPEGIIARPPPTEKYSMRFFLREHKLRTSAAPRDMRTDLAKKGEMYFRKHKRKLFQKICVEMKACKWSKEVLGDSKSLLAELIPLVGIVLGIAVPAIVVTIAILIVKWGIIKFCKCSET